MATVHAPDTGVPMWPHMAPMRTLADNWGWILLRGIVAVIFGVAAFVWPGLTLLTLVLLWGVYAIADGIFALAAAVTATAHNTASRWWLGVWGVISIAAGLAALVWPGMTSMILLLVIGIWAIATGILAIWGAIYLRREIEGEWLLGVTGVLVHHPRSDPFRPARGGRAGAGLGHWHVRHPDRPQPDRAGIPREGLQAAGHRLFERDLTTAASAR